MPCSKMWKLIGVIFSISINLFGFETRLRVNQLGYEVGTRGRAYLMTSDSIANRNFSLVGANGTNAYAATGRSRTCCVAHQIYGNKTAIWNKTALLVFVI